MVNLTSLPPIPGAIGPGSQPLDEDGGQLEYMEMPKEMITFQVPHLPEPEEMAGLEAALVKADAILAGLKRCSAEGEGAARTESVDLTGLDETSFAFINELLGEGEVSIIGGDAVQAQESVLAGVWRVRQTGPDGGLISDQVEIAPFPTAVQQQVFAGAAADVEMPDTFGDNIFNTPALIAEINENIPHAASKPEPYVINLSLLPHTEEDLAELDRLLGRGATTILSRGYGNCRVTATGTSQCWWVQFYNSQDTLILNTIEITAVPNVVLASREDLEDSTERLDEILEIYR